MHEDLLACVFHHAAFLAAQPLLLRLHQPRVYLLQLHRGHAPRRRAAPPPVAHGGVGGGVAGAVQVALAAGFAPSLAAGVAAGLAAALGRAALGLLAVGLHGLGALGAGQHAVVLLHVLQARVVLDEF